MYSFQLLQLPCVIWFMQQNDDKENKAVLMKDTTKTHTTCNGDQENKPENLSKMSAGEDRDDASSEDGEDSDFAASLIQRKHKRKYAMNDPKTKMKSESSNMKRNRPVKETFGNKKSTQPFVAANCLSEKIVPEKKKRKSDSIEVEDLTNDNQQSGDRHPPVPQIKGQEAETAKLNNETAENQSNRKHALGKKRQVLDKMPLMLPKKEQSLVLMRIDDERLRLGAEVGAVGRLKASKKRGLSIDLKGQSYKASYFRTAGSFAIVGYGADEARIEAVSNGLIRLNYKSSIFELGAMKEGEFKSQHDEDDLDYDVNKEWKKEKAGKKRQKKGKDRQEKSTQKKNKGN